MNFRPGLTPRPTQGLRLTPGLQQGLNILRLPAADLVAELRRMAVENPLLRLDETGPEGARAGWDATEALAARETLGERLRRQIALMPLEPRVTAIAQFLTGDIGEDGYLDPDAAGTLAALGLEDEHIAAAIAALQSCEPAGVGARSLEECLALQMRERGVPEAEARAACAHLDLLAERRFDALSAATGLPPERLRPMAEMLPRLNPCPGDGINDEPLPPIPEILVEEGPDGTFVATLDRQSLPRARVDRALAEGLAGRPDSLRLHEAAQTLIGALRFRERTLKAVARLIVTRQHRFFAAGPEHLAPMTRAELAGALGLHPSTVGRALAGKALAFRGAVHPLALFVSPPLPGRGEVGATAFAVQRRIRRLVDAEPPGEPLSDERIAALLRGEGVDIARRTVAKYRRCLTIPSSFERRRRKGPSG